MERLQIHLKFCCVSSELQQQLLMSAPCSSVSPTAADPVSPSSAQQCRETQTLVLDVASPMCVYGSQRSLSLKAEISMGSRVMMESLAKGMLECIRVRDMGCSSCRSTFLKRFDTLSCRENKSRKIRLEFGQKLCVEEATSPCWLNQLMVDSWLQYQQKYLDPNPPSLFMCLKQKLNCLKR